MKPKIIPSIIAKSQKEFDERFSKVKSLGNTIHLDVMDGKFVKNKSLDFDLTLPRKRYHVHLMVGNPEKYIKIIYSKADTIIFHIGSCKTPGEVRKVLSLIKSKKRKAWIALNPKTSVKKIESYLKSVDGVLLMEVTPGKYGAKFLPKSLKKVKELRKLNKKINIGVDGGINDKTISRASKSGANVFVIGSYLQNAENPRKAMKELVRLSK